MRRRGIIPLLIVFLVLLSLPVLPATGQTSVTVLVDGDPVAFDQPPVIVGSRVLVPLRGVFERTGATVEWNAATRTVLALRGTTLVELRIGDRVARVNERAVTLDVPAMIVRARTLVPLRFVSEALGATVDFQADTRTVVIWTGQAAPPVAVPPPPPRPPLPPPRPSQVVRGVITAVTMPRAFPEPARIVVEADGIDYRIVITVNTVITRVEAASGIGGPVGVAALRTGDDAEVTFRDGVALRVRATYLLTSGRIDAVARARRTLVLTDGRAVRYVPEVTVLVNSQPDVADVATLRAGQVVELRLNPTSREAWEINIISGAAAVPFPEQMFLRVTLPRPGDVVASPVEVRGATVAGSRVEVAITWFLGLPVGRTVVTADRRGRFVARVPVNVVATNSSYLVTVTATHTDLGREQDQFTIVLM